MSSSRKARRRRERQRAKRGHSQAWRFSPALRIGMAALGMLLIIAAVLIVAAGGSGNAQRLARVAGIMIILGLASLAGAFFGRL